MDIRAINRDGWNKEVQRNNPWTRPVDSETIQRAKKGQWEIILTPLVSVPQDWYPPLENAHVLCLASGGGQQGPILAAAGADVVVYDNSPRQLAQDRLVADRDDLALETVEGDMRDLSCFSDRSFDLIVHPVSNVFVPDILPVWREAFRVLKVSGAMLSGICNPIRYLFDEELAEEQREIKIVNKLPYSDIEDLSSDMLKKRIEDGSVLEFSHTLNDQIGGQLKAGFVMTDFYEDWYDREHDIISEYTSTFFATRCIKPG